MTIDTLAQMIPVLRAVRSLHDAQPDYDDTRFLKAHPAKIAARGALDGAIRSIWRETVWTVRGREDMTDDEIAATDRLAAISDITVRLDGEAFLSTYADAESQGCLSHYLAALVDTIEAQVDPGLATAIAEATYG